MGIHDLWLFLLAGLLLNITPGPDMALVIARSTQFGTRAGIAAALGVGAGAFVHIAAAALGISALVMASAAAFSAIKLIGAGYLIYLGVGMIIAAKPESTTASGDQQRVVGTAWASFGQGFLTNVLNPKVAVFFLALLPQFIDPDAPSKALAFVILGLIFDATGTLWNVGIAVTAGAVGQTAGFASVKIWLERAIGALFVAVGAKLVLAERT
jgi:threonine/homoserine/homoserine lactone efflux protein